MTVEVESGGIQSLSVLVTEGQTVRICYSPVEPPSSDSIVFVSTESGTAQGIMYICRYIITIGYNRIIVGLLLRLLL